MIMKEERRTFSREFKVNAVELSYSRKNVADLVNELKIRPELLYRWRSEFEFAQSPDYMRFMCY